MTATTETLPHQYRPHDTSSYLSLLRNKASGSCDELHMRLVNPYRVVRGRSKYWGEKDDLLVCAATTEAIGGRRLLATLVPKIATQPRHLVELTIGIFSARGILATHDKQNLLDVVTKESQPYAIDENHTIHSYVEDQLRERVTHVNERLKQQIDTAVYDLLLVSNALRIVRDAKELLP